VRKVWVLDTETKGTGAHVVPLEKALKADRAEQELALFKFDRPLQPAQAPDPPAPLLFKVVNILSAEVLAEGIGARETVELLEGFGSVLDARIFQWMAETGRWRLLTLDESKALWEFRGRVAATRQPVGSGV
jgi:hypothetical protein